MEDIELSDGSIAKFIIINDENAGKHPLVEKAVRSLLKRNLESSINEIRMEMERKTEKTEKKDG